MSRVRVLPHAELVGLTMASTKAYPHRTHEKRGMCLHEVRERTTTGRKHYSRQEAFQVLVREVRSPFMFVSFKGQSDLVEFLASSSAVIARREGKGLFASSEAIAIYAP